MTPSPPPTTSWAGTPCRPAPSSSGAHPDDADFGAGGLVAAWAARGCEVTVVCVTDGDGGGFDASVPREDVPGIRRAEQQAAADALGREGVRVPRPP